MPIFQSRISRTILTLTAITIALVALLALPVPLSAGEESPTVEGRLLDPQGEPVSDARVTVLDAGEIIGEAESNLDGLFLVDLERMPQHDITVHIERAHFAEREWHGTPESLHTLRENRHLYLSSLTM
ncbi:MAG: carboxypeptidase regulatory-like domain-containing protein, partial [Chloroflexi bacterium]|nr:carboxypeptidase regulatory-like domain-containing protein [Chloroflexota bacterium]